MLRMNNEMRSQLKNYQLLAHNDIFVDLDSISGVGEISGRKPAAKKKKSKAL